MSQRRIAGTSLLIGLMVLVCAGPTFSAWSIQMEEEGTWVLSEDQDCAGSRLCMEWEPINGTPYTPSCCFENAMLGTTVFRPCAPSFRHFH